ncbi:aminopeptidase [Plantibacter sp. MCCC 1A11337]|uniref:M55 family metallopeptidase n=1 Tax=Plantibacter sp. MCCC 1A11337 TaxID=2736644 RepID=UPI0015827265|nr:M55 family metallopeptidase [Plantibacter sp. MCCC 1A11337]NUJ88564.1 aminopeptidase [Plantibacter sp. MCCC 1A11337]
MTDRSRLYISADLEGAATVVSPDDLARGGFGFDAARSQLTREVNAAIRGALEVDNGLQIVVSDAHGTYRNIDPLELDDRARLLQGKPRPLAMMSGVRARDGVMLIGYHARAGVGGVLSHTIDDAVRDVRCNGSSFGEAGLSALLATEVGASILLASGDDALAAELAALAPGLPVVQTKETVSAGAAVSEHPLRVSAAIEEASKRAVTAWSGEHVQMQGLSRREVLLEVEFGHPIHADRAELPPPVTRRNPTTVSVTCGSVTEAYRWARTLIVLATAS